jgi:hypothetical protein
MEYLKDNFIKELKNKFLQYQYEMDINNDKRINDINVKQEDILSRIILVENKHKRAYHQIIEKIEKMEKRQDELNQEMNKMMDIFMEYVGSEEVEKEEEIENNILT